MDSIAFRRNDDRIDILINGRSLFALESVVDSVVCPKYSTAVKRYQSVWVRIAETEDTIQFFDPHNSVNIMFEEPQPDAFSCTFDMRWFLLAANALLMDGIKRLDSKFGDVFSKNIQRRIQLGERF